MRYLIVIPTYNEAENIKPLIEEINRLIIGYDFSVLIVDDSSTDGTLEIVEKLQNDYENLFLFKRESKRGLASAYIDGFSYGIGLGFDYFIQMDADFSHNPKYLFEMFDKLKDNDLVIGSRNIINGDVIGWGCFRNFISKVGSFYSRMILGCPIYDLTGGFNGWSKDILLKIKLSRIISKGYSFQIEMKYKAYKNKAKIVEFPIIFENRKYGKSKMSAKIFFEALINVIRLKFYV